MKRCIIPFFIFAFFFSCSREEQQSGELPQPTVTDFIVVQKNIPAIFDFIGFAESSHLVEIRARVEGYLDKIAYVEGAKVLEGQLLFQLDPRQYEAQVEQSKAEVAKQQAILENANLTVNRLKPLYEKKAASKKDLDNAIAGQLSAEASLLSAKAQLRLNELNLEYTTILSPITGYSDKSRYREGALINPGANSLLTTISILDPIWVYFTVSENDILRVVQEQARNALTLPEEPNATLPTQNEYVIEVILSDGTIYPHKGTVDFSSPTYDQSTGTMLIRAVMPNPKAELRPGQFLRVKVYGAERPNAILVPQRALIQKTNGLFVYLIDKDNKVSAQDVSVGDWVDKDFQIVTNGLKPGDRIVVDGINKVLPGTVVKVTGEWNST